MTRRCSLAQAMARFIHMKKMYDRVRPFVKKKFSRSDV